MRLADYVLVVFMLLLGVFTLFWTAIGVWPTEWVRWRAEMGDQLAIEQMAKMAGLKGDADSFTYWIRARGEVGEHFWLFSEDRELMRKMLSGQGKETPLLDVMKND